MSEERKHSILAPSSKEWVHCGFSAKFLANKEEETNDASEFGTECHALADPLLIWKSIEERFIRPTNTAQSNTAAIGKE